MCILKIYWNNGYMTEAIREIIKYSFQKSSITKIMATCTNKNPGYYRVMEKCDMTKIKEEKTVNPSSMELKLNMIN